MDFSKPETRALYEAEVRKRMEAPFYMSRKQAEMLVAVLMTNEVVVFKKEERNDDE